MSTETARPMCVRRSLLQTTLGACLLALAGLAPTIADQAEAGGKSYRVRASGWN